MVISHWLGIFELSVCSATNKEIGLGGALAACPGAGAAPSGVLALVCVLRSQSLDFAFHEGIAWSCRAELATSLGQLRLGSEKLRVDIINGFIKFYLIWFIKFHLID